MSISRRKRVRVLLVLAVAAFGFVQILFQLFPGIFETWNSQVFDRFFLARSSIAAFKPAYDGTVVHVDLNNTAIRQLGTFYLTRSHYARAMRNLAAMGTAAQVYDLIFAAETSHADDKAIIDATSEAGNVYFGMAFALVAGNRGEGAPLAPEVRDYLSATRWKVRVEGDAGDLYSGERPLVTFPLLAAASRGMGYLSLQTDRDGVIRRVPLLVRFEDAFYPSLAFRVVCDYLGVAPERITVSPGRHIRLAGARRPGGPPHDILIPIDRRANMIVNFTGPWGTMRHYNFAKIYAASNDRDEMEMWAEELSGKIAVISDVSTGATDIGPVPVDVNFPLSGLHANVIHTILAQNFLKEVPRAAAPAIEAGIVLVLLLMSLRLSPFPFFAGSALLVAGYGGGALLLFLSGGLMLDIVRPAVTAGTAASLIIAWSYFQDEKEKEALRRSFESYFPPAVVKRILANPALMDRGRRKELTILFSDIKDFTVHASSYSPDRIRAFLNEYFESMVDIVFAFEGTVDKYIGDGLMVFFGDPEPVPDHALRAVQAAVAMQKKARELTKKWLDEGGFPARIRIGINTGEVVVGNMGSSRRLSYTVLGSAVNLAKRLESHAPVDGILISQRTFDLLDRRIPVRSFGQIQVKGVEEPVSTYDIIWEEA
ncbi:MAG: adenylate/guanylate cyclase domain-containing protein [Syntrophobacteraceae bacterium]